MVSTVSVSWSLTQVVTVGAMSSQRMPTSAASLTLPVAVATTTLWPGAGGVAALSSDFLQLAKNANAPTAQAASARLF